MRYFASIGPVRYGFAGDTIDVLSDPEWRPIGAATCAGRDGRGLSLWRIAIRKARIAIREADLPGRFVIVDREFRPAPQLTPRQGDLGSR